MTNVTQGGGEIRVPFGPYERQCGAVLGLFDANFALAPPIEKFFARIRHVAGRIEPVFPEEAIDFLAEWSIFSARMEINAPRAAVGSARRRLHLGAPYAFSRPDAQIAQLIRVRRSVPRHFKYAS
jgi:hypothetical protein